MYACIYEDKYHANTNLDANTHQHIDIDRNINANTSLGTHTIANIHAHTHTRMNININATTFLKEYLHAVAPKGGTLSHWSYWNLLHKILDVAA